MEEGGMHMDFPKIMVLMLSLILISAGMPTLAADQGAATIFLGKCDDGREITIPVGSILVICLEQTAGTGYSWQIDNLDTNRLELLDTVSEPVKKDKHLVGGPMLTKWRLSTTARGDTELKMYYYRVWEGIDKAVAKFEIRVHII